MRLRFLRSLLLAAAVLVALPVSPARADTVTADSAPPLRFLSYNMCGSACKHVDDSVAIQRDDYIASQASGSGWNTDEIMLQEVCRNQFDDLKSKLGPKGFTGLFAQTIQQTSSGICDNYAYGMAIFVKGGVKATTVLPLTQGGETEDIDAPCMEHYLQYRLVWACSVHLYWRSTTADILLRHEEAAALAAKSKTWEDSGIPVVLGGDFNDLPGSATMDYFYSGTAFPQSSATGTFLEADETDTDYFSGYGCDPAQVTGCRSGAPTFYSTATGNSSKIDYVLVNDTKFKQVKGDSQPLDLTLSDHHMYRGAASWADCPGANPNGIIRREASGALFRYSGRTDGTIAPACKVGSGWNIMSTVARHGDFDGNGSEDLIAVDGSGNLWLYPADATGSFSGGTRRQIGTGWQIYNTLLASGDFNGDGRADLIGRDGSGVLWFYAGDGTGSYAPRVQIGTGWQTYDGLIAAGDVNGDAKPDLIGRDGSGDLWFYAGTGVVDTTAQGYQPRAQIGYSFPAGELIF